MKLVLYVSIDNNINCDKCVFLKHFVVMNAYIYISCIQLLNFFSAVTAKPNLWKIQLELNFGKPLLEQYFYQNVS